MLARILRKFLRLELEDRILFCGSFVGFAGVFLPWISGEWLGGEPLSASGFGFFTSFLGITVFLCHLVLLLEVLVPLTGGPRIIREPHVGTVRLTLAALATVLVLAALSILTKITFEFSRMEVRFGIYVSLIGSSIALLYSFLKEQEQRRSSIRAFFHYPEESSKMRPSQPLVSSSSPPSPPEPD